MYQQQPNTNPQPATPKGSPLAGCTWQGTGYTTVCVPPKGYVPLQYAAAGQRSGANALAAAFVVANPTGATNKGSVPYPKGTQPWFNLLAYLCAAYGHTVTTTGKQQLRVNGAHTSAKTGSAGGVWYGLAGNGQGGAYSGASSPGHLSAHFIWCMGNMPNPLAATAPAVSATVATPAAQ